MANLRRRLTVAGGPDRPSDGAEAADVPSEKDSDTEAEDLQCVWDVLEEAGESRHVALVSSRTDAVKLPAFEEKAVKVQHSDSLGTGSASLSWLKTIGVGWCCKSGLKPEMKNQDSFSVLVAEGNFAVYCVYDGHGPNGHLVSDVVRRDIVPKFIGHRLRETDTARCLEDVFGACHGHIMQLNDNGTIDAELSGCTVTVAYHDLQRNKLTIAHVGDSKAVLGRISGGRVEIDETIDHKPNLKEEMERIENSDPPGRVVFDGYFNHRVYAKQSTYPGLNMSRAIGDVFGQQRAGLTWRPEITEIDLAGDKYKEADGLLLLVCTDGVWEFFSAEEAVRLAYEAAEPPEDVADDDRTPAQRAIEHLARASYFRWLRDSGDEVADDITGIAVDLRHVNMDVDVQLAAQCRRPPVDPAEEAGEAAV